MIEITKNKLHKYFYYYIKNDEGTIRISFENNLDLYWTYIYEGNILNTPASQSFKITKENFFFYNLIDELYNNIINDNPFGEKIKKHEYDKFNMNKLFKNDIINWHSDDCVYEKASILEIKKQNEDYIITFHKSKEGFMSYSVRISNSGSRYGYFNIPFMNMYNKLCEYDPNYHQIHMEEYLYNEKVKKLK